MHSLPISHDVVIAGAGPVGLFLACELALQGQSVLVLEQAGDPTSPLKRLPFGMRGLSVPTLEALHRRGLLDAVKDAQQANEASGATHKAAHWMQEKRRPAGHFAGIPFFHDQIDASRWPWHLPSPAGTSLMVTLESLEMVLATRARALGVDIRRGVAVCDVDQTDDGVIVRSNGETFVGRWLVGCDGGRSTVRKLAGFELVGTDPEFTGYSFQAELEDEEVLQPGRTYTPTGMYTYARPGTIAMVDFDGGAFHRTQPITLEHVQMVLRRISQTGVTVTALHRVTTFTDRACQATHYRKGRILLAGDAAHIHSPLGGQGLNLGIGDAMNLGWKLATTIRGDAPAGLLDSYQDERHPVGKEVLDWSRAQVALMRPSPSSRALEATIRQLVDTRDGATYFAERVWGVSLRYDLGGVHPLVGRSVPDFLVSGAARVGDLMTRGRGLWLDFDEHEPHRELASRWHDRITYVSGHVENALGVNALLVRPDGVVAWVGESVDHPVTPAGAALRWFGEPGPLSP
ncbi:MULTISPECIES: FAD-dependent monooxygenase [Dyella]|uniref:FAD-dependent oxidoreductase n=2 Tax=Dyella TaxID=231454 RepID=A0A4R0Z1E3_9GAMM|nr:MULTISPECIES: FAD-dependent monooxygenase [Dyella]TBR39429.1 FAD-dependent oxidoreductase [Dyella terrae]TCI12986.1 FAD-dependent oxidoreductase [Dyella soli]